MKRTLERLTKKRQEKETEFTENLDRIKQKTLTFQKLLDSLPPTESLESLAKDHEQPEARPGKTRPSLFASKTPRPETAQHALNQEFASALVDIRRTLDQNLTLTRELFSQLADFLTLNAELIEARDREWDALGSNHVSVIFKSMEWRIDKMAAECGDAAMLIKNYVALREQLKRLAHALEGKDLPAPALVKEVAHHLEDLAYAGFENRFRGTEEEVKQQQKAFLDFFQPGKKVLDLGCGRGEFVELLLEKGIEAEGIDGNRRMVEHCREKGLPCRHADILEVLREYEDGILGGTFSSQVIEHLSPAYLKRMIELCYHKLAPTGRIVLETLNPTSLFALVQVYFLDLSHQQPLHPQTLRFLLENTGFGEVEIIYSAALEAERLQALPPGDEITEILNRNVDKVNQLLYAPVNYAAIGSK